MDEIENRSLKLVADFKKQFDILKTKTKHTTIKRSG
jgi:hypothetical protein